MLGSCLTSREMARDDEMVSGTSMNTVTETWARIPTWPAYEASTLGAIRRIGASKPLTPCPATKRAYLVVHLTRDGEGKNIYVHRAVAAAHLGDIDGMVVHHVNNCPQDNRLTNLEVVSRTTNIRRSHADGTAHVLAGEHAPEQWGRRGHLNAVQVQTLRRARASGEHGAVAELAREYGVGLEVAAGAARGSTYAWVGTTSLETELGRQEALAQRAARKATAQVQRARAARAANPRHTPPAEAASSRPRFAASKRESK